VYTDGACVGNPGPGGWAWAVPDGPFASGAEPLSTNQRMEIKAALEAVLALEGPLEVVSDSTYVVNCFRDRWWEGWLARGWLNKAKRPVANRDLWEPLIDEYRADPQRVHFTWVKGHSENAMNDVVDRLAVEAAQRQKGRHGIGVPADLGPADAVARAGTNREDPRAPEGHRLLVGGARPPEIGGYDENPLAARVRAKLTEILVAKHELHDDLVVLTGLGLGAEQLGAEAAAAAGVAYVAVLPYPDPDAVWPDASRARYARLLAGARDQVLLQTRKPETKQAAGGALARRDAWLARHALEAVVVWDGDEPRTGKLVRGLQDRLGDDVWVLTPVAL
jgi:ribonuclease HI